VLAARRNATKQAANKNGEQSFFFSNSIILEAKVSIMEGSGVFHQVVAHITAKERLLFSSSDDPREQFRQAKKLSELDAQITALLRSDALAAQQVCAQAWAPRSALLDSLAFQRAEFEAQGSCFAMATDNSSQKDTDEVAVQTPFEKLNAS
jgi:hypothetical protein